MGGIRQMSVEATTVAQLKSYIERAEHLHEERDSLASDLSDLYREAKGNGYDVTALKAVLKYRRQDPTERAEHESVVETYMRALGMVLSDPGVGTEPATRTRVRGGVSEKAEGALA